MKAALITIGFAAGQHAMRPLCVGLLLLMSVVLAGCGQTSQPLERLPGPSVQQTDKIGGDGGGGGM